MKQLSSALEASERESVLVAAGHRHRHSTLGSQLKLKRK